MRAIVVDDEPIMIKRFMRLSEGVPDLHVVGQFEDAQMALNYAYDNPIEVAFLDVEMPVLNGVELAQRLRVIRPDILIVFISAYDDYVREFNLIGGDYYIVKPFGSATLEMAMERISLIAHRQRKKLYIQTFGRFLVTREGEPIPLTGKAKEILALLVTRRGKEMSNEEIFRTIWEGRDRTNASMVVYYNAIRRLKDALEQAGIESLLISTSHGQMVDTSLFDCDYYAWQDGNMEIRDRFEGEFLSEYSWGEFLLADILM